MTHSDDEIVKYLAERLRFDAFEGECEAWSQLTEEAKKPWHEEARSIQIKLLRVGLNIVFSSSPPSDAVERAREEDRIFRARQEERDACVRIIANCDLPVFYNVKATKECLITAIHARDRFPQENPYLPSLGV